MWKGDGGGGGSGESLLDFQRDEFSLVFYSRPSKRQKIGQRKEISYKSGRLTALELVPGSFVEGKQGQREKQRHQCLLLNLGLTDCDLGQN